MSRKPFASFLAVLMTFCVAATVAAGPSDNANPAAPDGGNGAAVTQYTKSFQNVITGDTVCSGVRIVRDSGPNQFVKDSFECTITNLTYFTPGVYDLGRLFYLPPWPTGITWDSDYDGAQANSFHVVVTDNVDGSGTLSGEAYY